MPNNQSGSLMNLVRQTQPRSGRAAMIPPPQPPPVPQQMQPLDMEDEDDTIELPDWQSAEVWQHRYNINSMPDKYYKVGRVSIQRQFIEDMNRVRGLPDNSIEKQVLSSEAAANFQMRMSELNMQKVKAKSAFRQINLDPKFSREEKVAAKESFLKNNPVWKQANVGRPSITAYREPKGRFSEGYVQRTLGSLATDYELDRDKAIAYAAERLGIDFEEKYPEAMDIIERRDLNPMFEPIGLEEIGTPRESTGGLRKMSSFQDFMGEAEEEPTLPQEPVKPIEIPVEQYEQPPSLEAFRKKVADLKAENPEQAKKYYDKWVGKWR